ncbi:MAG: monovalent cation/H(+) antiporter subunit G [Lachnospiraceae bacterium]|nr:monovalent cation/H(+) antiporter subunit G [Lachnospiraceae bacterium]MBR5667115.1 monovalent cation/H(+) antiporter subunit G [Lachnospiraceae bacterium]
MNEWVVFSFAAILIIGGLLVSLIAAFGLFKFRFALNRMHAAAMCDTLAILLVLLGLIVIDGASILSLKLGLIIVLLWCASPVSSHLLANMEVIVSSKLKDNCEVPEQEEGGASES